ncbi:hypothetical protein CEXT_575391 [Caerostris extrusa]|uniref:Uncharacterized protein n=1 Tax=Caerostris extrusa TaxID=172846 RepID=A0AAV4YBL5_CAEEX|nr:hypothetical protein CEXT_575391 [Caerostris extrusa]
MHYSRLDAFLPQAYTLEMDVEVVFAKVSLEMSSSKTDNDINDLAKRKKQDISSYYTLVPKSHSKQSSFKTLTQTNPCSPMKFGIRAFPPQQSSRRPSLLCVL